VRVYAAAAAIARETCMSLWCKQQATILYCVIKWGPKRQTGQSRVIIQIFQTLLVMAPAPNSAVHALS